nr:hypothetical protein [Tanacetum cinerariifolium]
PGRAHYAPHQPRRAPQLPHAMGAGGAHFGHRHLPRDDGEPALGNVAAAGRVAGYRPGHLLWLWQKAQQAAPSGRP